MRQACLKASSILLLAAAGGCVAPAVTGIEKDYASLVIDAERSGKTFAQATTFVAALDEGRAYAIQHALVSQRLKRGDRVAGFKSGLMSARSLSDRKASRPLVGALFRAGQASTGAGISLCGYRRPALEMKIGFVFARAVRTRLASIESLKARVGGVVPVVELPDIAYADGRNYLALDMIAANISSARFVRGGTVQVPAGDLDRLPVEITRDGAPVARGHGGESLDGQWSSLLTMVNILIENGYTIAPGQFVLTGKIGDKVDVIPGSYRADYGPIGAVDFSIAGCI